MAENDMKRFSDRKEGRTIRSLPAPVRLTPYVTTARDECCSRMADSVEVSAIEQWLLEAREGGWSGIGFIHLLVAAYVRTVSMRPGINRFIVGRRIYARNDIQVVFPVRRTDSYGTHQTMVKVSFGPTDTVYDVFRRMNETVDDIKANMGATELEKTSATFMRIPRPFLRLTMGVLRWMNYQDWLPRSLLEISPYHASLTISDMGSLGVPPESPALPRFGTLPMALSFGAKRRCYETEKDGRVTERHYVDYCIACDNRMADAPYFAGAYKCLKYFLKNPKLLELPPETVEDDVN